MASPRQRGDPRLPVKYCIVLTPESSLAFPIRAFVSDAPKRVPPASRISSWAIGGNHIEIQMLLLLFDEGQRY
jgi:hypothetical protein